MSIPANFLDELIARSDIVDVISDYVHLTKKGSNLFGLCPFHSEKTGSFSVSPDKQIYHCFGCGKGGGVINFIMEEENLSFPDAVRFLAKRAGMEVPEEDRRDESSRLPDSITSCSRGPKDVPCSNIWTAAGLPAKPLCALAWAPPSTNGTR